MKYISYFLFSILLISCDILESSDSDIDENSTFLERFDGVSFEDTENNK